MARIGTVTVVRYETSDGSLFENIHEAEYHEKKIILGNFFETSTDPVIQQLSPQQCQSILSFFSKNLNSIVTELQISALIEV